MSHFKVSKQPYKTYLKSVTLTKSLRQKGKRKHLKINAMTEFLVPATVFATIYGIFFLFIRKRERMALLERGLDPRSFEKESSNFSTLKYGLLLTGVGLGILLANIIVSIGAMGSEPAYFSFITLFGGLALIIDYIIESRLIKQHKYKKETSDAL